MHKVKAGLRGLNPSQKQQRAAIVYNHMHGNANYPDPSPSMAEFHAAYIELKEANLGAMDRGRKALFRRDRAVERMDSYLTRLAGYVNSVCLGDLLKLSDSGFELAKHGSPIRSLKRPEGLTVRATPYPGQVKLRWERVPGAIIYIVERALHGHGEPENWVQVDLTSRPTYVLSDLEPQVPQWFRVRARGTQAEGPNSAHALGKAA